MRDISFKFAQSQSDIVEASLNHDLFKDEQMYQHPLATNGWMVMDRDIQQFRRMERDEFVNAIRCLLQQRPSAVDVDIKPVGVDVEEKIVFNGNTAFVNTSFLERAQTIADEMSRSRKAAGFKLSIFNTDNRSAGVKATLVLYMTEDEYEYLPLDIHFKWMKVH